MTSMKVPLDAGAGFELLGVELDDERFANWDVDVVALREVADGDLLAAVSRLQPAGDAAVDGHHRQAVVDRGLEGRRHRVDVDRADDDPVDALDDRGVPAPGKTAFWNYNRFSNPDVPALLDAAAAAKSDDEAKAAYAKLDKIYRATVPVVPLMYRPFQFFEFNESNWTGFPTEQNAYAPPMYGGAGIQWLFKIKKVGT